MKSRARPDAGASNVNKHLNVMLVRADNKIAVMEKMFSWIGK